MHVQNRSRKSKDVKGAKRIRGWTSLGFGFLSSWGLGLTEAKGVLWGNCHNFHLVRQGISNGRGLVNDVLQRGQTDSYQFGDLFRKYFTA